MHAAHTHQWRDKYNVMTFNFKITSKVPVDIINNFSFKRILHKIHTLPL